MKLAAIAPGDIDHFFFTNGGAEANENAIRIARAVTGRPEGARALPRVLRRDGRRDLADRRSAPLGREPGIPGIVRAPEFHKWGRKEPEPVEDALADLEDVIRYEGAPRSRRSSWSRSSAPTGS